MAQSTASDHTIPRLAKRYQTEIAPALAQRFGHTNLFSVARLNKIVLNVGCGEAAHEAKVLEQVQRDLGLIAGQRPMVTRARQAISNFKIKEGDPVGCKVTLRRARMYEFLDRLISVSLPRIRDFRGFNPHSFDQQGNFNFGLQEQVIFPEVSSDKMQFPLGMDIVIGIRTTNPEEARALLEGFGFPFTKAS